MVTAHERDRRALAVLLTVQRFPAVCAIALLCLSTSSSAQSGPSQPASPVDAALRALDHGRFEEVGAILRDSTDPRAVVLRARADVARGRYPEAERLLSGPAESAPGGDAALELGLLYSRLGRRAEAARALQGVLARSAQSTPSDLVRLALAARVLGRFQDANGLLRRAAASAPTDPRIHIAWGELFLEKYDRAEALKSFQQALKLDDDSVSARVGIARALAEGNPPAAREVLDEVFERNPNSLPAHLLVAELALDDRRRGDAQTSVQRALEVNPNDLETRALDAAIALLDGRTDEFEAKAASILKLNPVYADAYRIAGEHLGRNYRFDEAVALTRRALTVDPLNARAHADLGMHLLRTGDEAGARRSLEIAFKADPFDVVTYNLLTMMDTLDKFVTVRDGDVILRLHPDEAAVMREFVMPLAQQALRTLAAQYQIQVQGPILIEMFPKHDDFAVRTLGLPGMLGALGACFGRVVTLDSPKARPPGEFSWAGTLWHEIAHVITLQMSNNRVPRWLTEGISVFEERRHRPEWGREMEVAFAQALNAGKTLKLRDLNDGFSDPTMISLAYYQASLVVGHIISAYGEPALRQLLMAYGRGLETEEAIAAGLGVSIDQVQTSFDAQIERDFASLRAALRSPELPPTPTLDQLKALAASNPGSFKVQMTLARALHDVGDGPAAILALERAARLLPPATGPDNPNALIALIATERGDTARAVQALEAVLKVDHTDVESARKLAALFEQLGDAGRAGSANEIVAELDPFDAEAQGRTGRWALQSGNADRAVHAFRAALASNPSDRAAAHLDLGEAYLAAGEIDEAKREALAALEIAPSFERAQDLLLKTVDERSSPRGGGE